MRLHREIITSGFGCVGHNNKRMLPPIVKTKINESLRISITSFTPVSGGCINNGGKITFSSGSYFVKWNDNRKFPEMFIAEGKGLTILRDQNIINIPKVILVDVVENYQFIILEWIETSACSKTYWQTLGENLAALHSKTSDAFGLDHDNYIGSLKQINTPKNRWIDFFIENRLETQLRLAIDNRNLDHNISRKFNSLYKKLTNMLPEEKPALLHGDLWSGNLMTNNIGEPCLIDPAVYYGNREAEISFTKLFGGFAAEFYQHYNDENPLVPNFESRIDIYNLYPLLVHVNLFGGAYAQQVKTIVERFA
jgi:protein-ribulosamine 3-kinase